jgi:hypothetical protein
VVKFCVDRPIDQIQQLPLLRGTVAAMSFPNFLNVEDSLSQGQRQLFYQFIAVVVGANQSKKDLSCDHLAFNWVKIGESMGINK